METTNKNIKIGCTFPLAVIIFLAFFFAKIFDKIDWSWWWVFSPLWIPLALVGLILLIMGLIWVGAVIIDKYF
jgi:hypothetical protein